jgi:hypothetical protein
MAPYFIVLVQLEQPWLGASAAAMRECAEPEQRRAARKPELHFSVKRRPTLIKWRMWVRLLLLRFFLLLLRFSAKFAG